MAYRDLKSNIDLAQSIVPQVLSATGTGSTVDLRGYDSAVAEISAGAVAGAGDFTPKMQESDDDSSWSDVAAADLHGSFDTIIAQNTIKRVGYAGAKRYVRIVITKNGGTSVAASATFIRSRAARLPLS